MGRNKNNRLNQTMTYPLGSFPRFGHQARWASERRNRAILNSIMTRQADAEDHLRKEIALHDVLSQLVNSMHSKAIEGQREIHEWKARLESIRQRHQAGKRVYYRKLIEVLLFFCDATSTHPELKGMSHDDHKRLVEDLAERHLRGETVLHQTKAPG
jgi:hypothetical protein